jgi:hypothetical protein
MPMARFARTTANPALDAAGLLRRLGFFLLAVASPVLAVTSRRGLVIVAPVGIALMVLAAMLESEGREPLASARSALSSLAGAVAAFLVFWATLSLLWAPFPTEALDRIVNIIGMGMVGLAAAAAVPARMRASNLYLLPIGCALAAIAALALILGLGFKVAGEEWFADRGLLLVTLIAPAATAWLVSRGRLVSGVLLIALVTAGLVLDRAWAPLASLVLGALVFVYASTDRTRARSFCTIVLPGLVILAPLLPFLLRPTAKLVLGTTDPRVETIRAWCRMVSDTPFRLVTGHGLETAARAKAAGWVPDSMPNGLMFDTWFELGVLGAVSVAALLGFAAHAAGRLSPAVAPGALMTVTVGFAMASLGLGLTQSWWLLGLAMAAVFILAVERGQFRTTRPRSTGPDAA